MYEQSYRILISHFFSCVLLASKQLSHAFMSEPPQQRNGQRADKVFKDLVITVSNVVSHNSYILVKGKNHIQGTPDLQIRQAANMAKHAKIQFSTDTAFFHQGHQGCYTGNTCAHECDSSDKLKIKNNTHTQNNQ